MRKFLLLFFLAALVGGYWLYTSPQRMLAQLKVAADTNDAAAFQRLVDVPAMQADMLSQLLGPPPPHAGPILVTGLSMLGLNQTATPRGLQPYLRGYRAPALGLGDGQGGVGRYAAPDRYLFATTPTSAGRPGATLVLQRQGMGWRLLTIKMPGSATSVAEPPAR